MDSFDRIIEIFQASYQRKICCISFSFNSAVTFVRMRGRKLYKAVCFGYATFVFIDKQP